MKILLGYMEEGTPARARGSFAPAAIWLRGFR
jgi:hypothetical protein